MEKSLDKDIERVKELQSTIYEGGDYIYLNKNDKQALGNVLKELEKKELEIKVNISNLALLNDNNNKLKQDLETWKKIAEKLASTTYDYANLEMLNICPAEYEGKVDLRKCKQNHIERNCIQCIIDWARNEEN